MHARIGSIPTDDATGLTDAEAESRRRGGMANTVAGGATRSYATILRTNVFSAQTGLSTFVCLASFLLILFLAPPTRLFAA